MRPLSDSEGAIVMAAPPADVMKVEQVAAILGVTTRRVQQLREKANPIPVNSDGRYPCLEFGLWYRQYLLERMGVNQDGSVYDFNAEKARLTHHQANISELEEETKKGNLIPAEIVKQHWESKAANTRAKLLNLPGRLAVSVVGANTIQDAEKTARQLITEALNELSGNGLPKSD